MTCLVVETAVVAVLQDQPRLEVIAEREYCLPPAGTAGEARLVRKQYWRFQGKTRWVPMGGEVPQPLLPDQVEWTGPVLAPPPSRGGSGFEGGSP